MIKCVKMPRSSNVSSTMGAKKSNDIIFQRRPYLSKVNSHYSILSQANDQIRTQTDRIWSLPQSEGLPGEMRWVSSKNTALTGKGLRNYLFCSQICVTMAREHWFRIPKSDVPMSQHVSWSFCIPTEQSHKSTHFGNTAVKTPRRLVPAKWGRSWNPRVILRKT